MSPKEFLDWYRYSGIGGRRMYKNYGILKRENPVAFQKLAQLGRFKFKKEPMGKLLEFPKEQE